MIKKINACCFFCVFVFIITFLFSSCNDNLDETEDTEETSTSSEAVLYVDIDADGNNDGSSWEDAYTDLQSALEIAEADDEIWVAEGTYYPTSDDDREIYFQMVEDVDVYGGFSGSETSLEDRDWETNTTILSGNIGSTSLKNDNTYHVVNAADNSLIDGFTVQYGFNINQSSGDDDDDSNHTSSSAILSSDGDGCGAGLLNYQACTSVRNVIFSDNYSAKGGAVYNMTRITLSATDNENPVFINVTFQDNKATGRGGAVANDLGTHPIFVNCTFSGNICTSKGGAIYNDFACNPVIINSSFTSNEALRAGVLGNDGGSNSLLVNVTMSENTAEDMGAGLYQGSYAASKSSSKNTSTIINSIITSNYTDTNGLVSCMNWGKSWVYASACTIDDWEYEDDDLSSEYSTLISAADACLLLDADEIYSDYVDVFIDHIISVDSDDETASFDVMTAVTEVDIPETIGYVDGNATGQNDGSSWDDAYTDLQTAIDEIYSQGGGQLWVAEGSYTPGSSRDDSFELNEYVGIYGGFSGNETLLSERDYDNNETILSGDIGTLGVATDNVYHVVLGSQYALIDGVTIQDAYADGEIMDGFGGGMQNVGYASSTIVKNTIFKDNYAKEGGAVFNFYNSVSYFYNVTIEDNSADMGGGIACRSGCNIFVENSLIQNNEAEYRAGALLVNYGSNVICTDVSFTSNTTNGNGGAVWVDDQASQYGGTLPVFTTCSFSDNSAAYYGGAIHNFNSAETTISSCTFSGNSALYGSDLANTESSTLTVVSTSCDTYSDDSSTVE
jgi:predicted outer membrane repeat protein